MQSVQNNAAAEASRAKCREQFRQSIERREFPALPVAAIKALEMLRDPDLNIRALCRVLSDEPELAGKILAIGRSAYYGQRSLPTDLQTAVQVMGLRDLRNVIVSLVTHGLFKSTGLLTEMLWSHSLAVALASRLLSIRLGLRDPEQAFLAGFLHDVGQMMLLHGDPEGFSQIARDARQNNSQMAEKEQELYGLDHNLLAVALIESWNLGVEIGEAIGAHHNCDKVIDPRSLSSVLRMAHYLAFKAGLGFCAPALLPSPEILQTFAFDNDDLLTRAVEEVRQVYNTESALIKSA
jgi:putative nucleotidyltransferase with HDIG domain